MTTLTVTNLRIQGRGPFDLTLAKDECVAISGASGSGKSLLLRAIADIESHQGECRLDNQCCAQMPAPQWRRHVALLPAKPQWWFDTVAEHFQHRDEQALSQLGFGSDTWQWQISRLSSGEQQRLALLRLLQHQPRVLLLDEPTASLDSENCQRVEQLVQHYQSQHHCPIVWVTHDLQQARRVANRHYILNNTSLELAKEQSA